VGDAEVDAEVEGGPDAAKALASVSGIVIVMRGSTVRPGSESARAFMGAL
jgi:hypothetical protein